MKGIAFKLGQVAMFTLMAALIKWAAARGVPPGETVFFRSFFAAPVIIGWLAMRRELATGLKTQNPIGHFWRGLVGTMAMGCMFTGLALLPLPEVTAIGYAAPLLVVILAAMFLGEQVGPYRLGAVLLGFIGVLIILSPRLTLEAGADSTETLGAVILLFGAMCAAMAQVFIRRLTRTEGTAAIVFWFSITASVLSLLTLPWGWVVPDWPVAAALMLAGLVGGFGQIFLTSSYRYADASLVAPFEYSSMLLALGVGYFVFGEVPTAPMLIGAAVVIVAGIVIIWRERQLGLDRARQRKVTTPQG